MNEILFALSLLLPTQVSAQQVVTLGGSALRVLPSGQAIVEINGDAAKALFLRITNPKHEYASTNPDGSKVENRVGENMTCSHVINPQNLEFHYCTTGEVGADGSIGVGAAD